MSKKRKGRVKMNPKENPQEMMPEEEKQPAEDEIPETEAGEPEEEAAPEKEKTELEAAEEKVAEYLAMAQRVQADFENFRRRNESVRSDSFAEGKRDVAAAMLPVLDNLERAADDVYQKLSVTPINRLGEKFDPNLENAVLQGTEDEGEPGTVCQVLQKGYMMGDRVLRHAMVKVVPE